MYLIFLFSGHFWVCHLKYFWQNYFLWIKFILFCLKVCWETVDGIIHHRQSATVYIRLYCYLPIKFIFLDETCSSTTISILLLHYVSINLFIWTSFFFFFLRIFCLSTLFLSLVSLESSVTVHLVFEFLFWLNLVIVTV